MAEIVTPESGFKIQPSDIATPPGGHFWGAFDNNETEISARYIVRLCQEKGGWFPFTLEEIEVFYSRSGHHGFTFNWLIEPGSAYSIMSGYYLTGGGWVVERDGKYFVTDDFILRCYKSAPNKSS